MFNTDVVQQLFLALVKRHRPIVIGHVETDKPVEAMPVRMELLPLGKIAEVPFTKHTGAIPRLLQHFRDGYFRQGQPIHHIGATAHVYTAEIGHTHAGP